MDKPVIMRAPTLRRAAFITIAGYLLGFGVPFASYSILPKLYVPTSAAQTSANIVANQGMFVAAIIAFLLNFIGDIVAAFGLYALLRPVSAFASMFAATLRVVYATVGLAATLSLATAYRVLTGPNFVTALGRDQVDAQVQVAIASFNLQFAFSLILFGAYLVVLGLIAYRSGYIPKWLGVILVIDGAGWIATEAGPYLLPQTDLGFLLITSFGELVFLVWLIGWGTRLREPRSALVSAA